MQDILDLILFCIVVAFWWHAIMEAQRKAYGDYEDLFEENLTMEENPIKITIENYCEQIVTFTMSEDAEIESSLCIIDDKVTEVHINAYDKDILIKKEDI